MMVAHNCRGIDALTYDATLERRLAALTDAEPRAFLHQRRVFLVSGACECWSNFPIRAVPSKQSRRLGACVLVNALQCGTSGR